MLAKPTPNANEAIIVPPISWNFGSIVHVCINPSADTANWRA